MTLRDALQIMDAAVEQTGQASAASEDVASAMRFLRDWGVERDALMCFWNALRGSNEIGRFQGANAARNRIRLLLRSLPSPSGGRDGPIHLQAKP